MPQRSTCTIDGCDRPNKARGQCSKHYQRWLKANRLEALGDVASKAKRRDTGCSIDDCGAPIKARGMCRRHYLRWWRTGKVVLDPRPNECAVTGCATTPSTRGWCTTHYNRWRYAGDPVKGPTLVACESCCTLFIRSANGTAGRCEQCRSDHARKLARDGSIRRRHLAEHVAKVRSRRQERSRPCLLCSERVEQDAGPGPLLKFCSDECFEAYEFEWRRSWRAKNRDKLQARQHRRRALKFGADYEAFRPSEIFERDHWRCYLCREGIDPELDYPHPRRVVLEHVVPLDRGGGHTRANTRAAHSVCNGAKGTRLLSELSLSHLS